MGKKTKEHRKKIALRNQEISHKKQKIQKAQKDFLMQLINKEKEEGKFNSPVMPMPGFDGPTLGLPIGPQI